jgi:hypothetical protein
MIRTARASLAAFALLLVLAGSTLAQDRAQEVLAQARAALGNKAALANVTAVTVGATVRRVIPAVGMELNSDVQLEFLFPDKYRRTEAITIGPVSRTVSVGLSGDQLLYDDGGAAAMMGTDPTAPGPVRDQTIKGLKEDAFRMLTVLLLAPPSDMNATFTSGGVAEAPDGKADVVDVKGPGTLNLRMFFDTVSHRLLMATYTTESVDPEQMKAFTQQVMEKAKADPANAQQIAKDAAAEMLKLPKKMIPMQMHFSESKSINGTTLPSKMTVDGGAQGQEEWTISSFKLNPPLKPERFVK